MEGERGRTGMRDERRKQEGRKERKREEEEIWKGRKGILILN